MYTQCPECQIAFRVTANVLQQASGNVRCGNCNHAFNALQYLSEEMPEPATVEDASTEDLSHDELTETSRRLLETLDELAGSEDVRIEDTGVEWRVLDEAAMDLGGAAMDEGQADQTAADEPRYDDNTPLPEDFDGEPDVARAAIPQRRDEDHTPRGGDLGDRQGDLALSEPEDWTDILKEVSDPDAEPIEVEEELIAIHNELASIDDALTDEVPQLEDDEFDDTPAFGDDETESEGDVELRDDAELEGDVKFEYDVQPEGDSEDEDEDEDEIFADGIDVGHEDEDRDFSGEIDVDDELGDDEDTGVFEAAHAFEDTADSFDDRESTGEFRIEDEFDEPPGGDGTLDSEPGRLGEAGDEPATEDYEVAKEDSLIESLELETGDDLDSTTDENLDASGEHDSPEPESLTDEPLRETPEDELAAFLAETDIAESDDDQEDEAEEKGEELDFTARLMGLENPEDLFDESSGEVETIIMEGEFVRSEIEKERIAAEHAARSQLDDPARLADTYATSRDKLRGGRRSYDPPSARMVAAIAGLGLLLVGQVVHNARESLATFGFFNQTIAPVYRLFGSPVTPEWDIRGWQFEATNGSVDENETTLTIVSRIVNRSEDELPYPLVHLSLTNRYEDVMGSRMLEPGEYLPGDLDPSNPVPPGENFTAVLEVEDPSPDATGFKLNVCYRVRPGTVRCAIEDFKN